MFGTQSALHNANYVIYYYRQGGARVKDQKADREIRASKESQAVPAPDANAEVITSNAAN